MSAVDNRLVELMRMGLKIRKPMSRRPARLVVAFVFSWGAWAMAAPLEGEVPIDLDSVEETSPSKEVKEGEEVEINLDDLGEESGENEESYLPVNTDSLERETHPLFILTVLGVLLPMAAMLFPPRRKKAKAAPNVTQNAD